MKLCDRCRVPGCLLDYGGKACKNARKQNCPDVVFTNADRVREMNDEELAKFMLSSDGAAYCKNNDRDSTCYLKGRDGMTACELCALDWLREEPVEVLSMYDGMSCGHIALDKLGVDITVYYATEIDKYAIQTTQHNYPETVQLGDAFQVRDDEWRPRRAAEVE